MVRLYTNLPGFYNDICEEIRLFIEEAEIILHEGPVVHDEECLSVFMYEEGGVWRALSSARMTVSGKPNEARYEYRMPAHKESALVEKRYKKRCVKIAVFRLMRLLYSDNRPVWGSLTGIRPTRLLRELQEEMGEQKALETMLQDFDVHQEKLDLAKKIVYIQHPILEDQDEKDVDVYIGVPFCKSRCLYCSFASSIRGEKTDMRPYLFALRQDIAYGAKISRDAGMRVRAMYVGGGTPTVLTAEELEDVLSFALDAYGGFGRELTVEAGRPDTVDMRKLVAIRRLGAGRISINPQTMNDKTLQLIGRSHTSEEIEEAFAMARDVGFACVNMDLIAGLPGEKEADMRNTLDRVMRLKPQNLTVHTLAVKRSSLLKARLDEFPLPDAETASRMVSLGAEAAKSMGMRPYYMYRQKYMSGNLENVGYALEGHECIYNIDMMEETTSIMAHGAGAMTKRVLGGQRRVERIPHPKDIDTYINKLNQLNGEKAQLFIR